MLSLLAQLQKKLQLDYKTNITQNCQKTELYGNLAKDLRSHIHVTSIQMGRKGGDMGRGGEVQRGSRMSSPHSPLVD